MFFRLLSFVLVITFVLSSTLYAGGAGVLLMFSDETVLLGKERRSHGYAWSDFGGKKNRHESLAQTAFRECKEETGHYSFPRLTLQQIARSPYVEHHHPVGSYRLYLVHVQGPKPSLHVIAQNARKAKQNLGRNAHVEKVEWKYVSAQSLLKAVAQNTYLPGTREEIFAPFKACLKKPKAQAILANLRASFKRTAPQPPAFTKPKAKNSPSLTIKKPVAKKKPLPIKKHVYKKKPLPRKHVYKKKPLPIRKHVYMKKYQHRQKNRYGYSLHWKKRR